MATRSMEDQEATRHRIEAMKVMLVEAKGAVRLRVKDARLEGGSQELTVCTPDSLPNHPRAFTRVRRGRPDVVVLDVQMPGGGAIELINRIKSLPQPPVVIALSFAPSLKYRTLRAGAEFFFDLIHEPDGLTHAVAELKNELQC
ncbi:MAG TPA: response regulator [Spirochaetia bacterium]|nr:response regulator [Spirochaetia bacterium]